MINSCGVYGCNNNQKNCSLGFYRLPNVRNTSEEDRNLSMERRRLWLGRLKRNNLSECQLADKNSTLKVCGRHFINSKPSMLYETTNPDWAPTLHLGHSEVKIPDPKRNQRAQKRKLIKSSCTITSKEAKRLKSNEMIESEYNL